MLRISPSLGHKGGKQPEEEHSKRQIMNQSTNYTKPPVSLPEDSPKEKEYYLNNGRRSRRKKIGKFKTSAQTGIVISTSWILRTEEIPWTLAGTPKGSNQRTA